MYVDTPFEWVDLAISATPVAEKVYKIERTAMQSP